MALSKVATAISYDPALLASSIDGDTYEYADALEIETIGTLKASTLKRLRATYRRRRAIEPQFWHLRDRSDTGYRCVVPNTSTQPASLARYRGGDGGGPQPAGRWRPSFALLAGIELAAGAVPRIDMVELRTSALAKLPATMVATFKAIRLRPSAAPGAMDRPSTIR